MFKHPEKKDFYIVLADRWVPDFVMTKERTDWLTRAVASNFNKNYKATLLEKIRILKTPLVGNTGTSKSEYVWLPLKFEGNQAIIDWYDEWTIEQIK